MLQKGIYQYEHMNDCEIFNETSLSKKEGLYSHLNMKYITDADYICAKKVWKDFKIKIEVNTIICMLKVINIS